jgi:hypothetical protein
MAFRPLSQVSKLAALVLLAACAATPEEDAPPATGTTQAAETVGWDGAFQNLGGQVGTPNQITAFVDGTGAVGTAQIGSGNNVWARFENNTTDVWQEGTFTGWINLQGVATSPPTMALDNQNRVSAFIRGVEGQLWTKNENTPGDHLIGPGAMQWTTLGGSLAANTRIAAVRNGAGVLEVFALRNDGELITRAGLPAATFGIVYGPWADLGVKLTGAPAAAVDVHGMVHVFGRGTAGDVLEVVETVNNSTNPTYRIAPSLGGQVNGRSPDVAVAAWNTGGAAPKQAMEIFAVNLYGQLCSTVDSPNGWNCYGQTLTTSPSAVTWNGKPLVFARGIDNGVLELYVNDTGTKTWVGLGGSIVSQPVAAVAVRGTQGGQQEFPHVFVVGTELATWHRQLFASPAPQVNIEPTTYTFKVSSVDVVSYVDVPSSSPGFHGYVDRLAIATQRNTDNPFSTACSLGMVGSPSTNNGCVSGMGIFPFNGKGAIWANATVQAPSDTVNVAIALDNVEAAGGPGNDNLFQMIGNFTQLGGGAVGAGAAIAEYAAEGSSGPVGWIAAVATVVGQVIAMVPPTTKPAESCVGGLMASPANPTGNNASAAPDTTYLSFTAQQLEDLTAGGDATMELDVGVSMPVWDPGNGHPSNYCSSSHKLHLTISRDWSHGRAAAPKSGDSAIGRTTDELDVFDASFGATRHYWNGYSWQSEKIIDQLTLQGGVSGQTAFSAVAPTPYGMDVYWADSNQNVAVSTWSQRTSSWSANVVTSGPNVPANAYVAAVSRRPWIKDVFWVGVDGSIQTAFWNNGFTSWVPYAVTGPGVAQPGGGIAVVSRGPDVIDVFYAHPSDGSLWRSEWAPGWTTGPISAPGVISAGANITAVARAANKVDAFFVGQNAGLWTAAFSTSDPTVTDGWTVHAINSAANLAWPGTLITAVSRQPNALDVVFLGYNNQLYWSSWNNDLPGADQFPTAPINVPNLAIQFRGSLSLVSRGGRSLDLFFKDFSSQVETAYWSLGNNQWTAPGGPLP